MQQPLALTFHAFTSSDIRNSQGLEDAYTAFLRTFLPLYTPDEEPFEVWLRADGPRGPVACGGLRRCAVEGALEVKRLFVDPAYRGQGIARAMALELERRAAELGFEVLVLDSNDQLAAAKALYVSLGVFVYFRSHQ